MVHFANPNQIVCVQFLSVINTSVLYITVRNAVLTAQFSVLLILYSELFKNLQFAFPALQKPLISLQLVLNCNKTSI